MLEYLDRIQLAVPDADAAAKTFTECFDAESVGEADCGTLSARQVTVRVGDSEVELLEPKGPGPVADAVGGWGGGLFGAGFATADPDGVAASLEAAKVPTTVEGDRLYFGPTPVGGLRGVISPDRSDSSEKAGVLSHIYEVTNPVKDFQAAVDHYATAFGLDDGKFCPIQSDAYAYDGSLTLFDPPAKLDRIEVTQTTDETAAMGRFYKRRGESFYMCFAEVDDFSALRERLDAAKARYALDPNVEEGVEPDVLFVHPKSLHGMLMGISLTGVAWRWSSAH